MIFIYFGPSIYLCYRFHAMEDDCCKSFTATGFIGWVKTKFWGVNFFLKLKNQNLKWRKKI